MTIRAEKTVLQVSFSKEKLEALKFYMDEKDTTVEKELQAHIKSVYEKYVPAPTRRYLDRNDSAEDIQAEVTVGTGDAQQETAATTATTTRARRRNTREQTEEVNEAIQSENTSSGEENQEQSDQESQGMGMSM